MTSFCFNLISLCFHSHIHRDDMRVYSLALIHFFSTFFYFQHLRMVWIFSILKNWRWSVGLNRATIKWKTMSFRRSRNYSYGFFLYCRYKIGSWSSARSSQSFNSLYKKRIQKCKLNAKSIMCKLLFLRLLLRLLL